MSVNPMLDILEWRGIGLCSLKVFIFPPGFWQSRRRESKEILAGKAGLTKIRFYQ